MKAFFDLSTCRSSGLSIGPIPWNEIVRYAEVYGIDEDNVEPFIDIIREMDQAYIKWMQKEQENSKPITRTPAASPSAKRPSPPPRRKK